jgi:hypothetical protein
MSILSGMEVLEKSLGKVQGPVRHKNNKHILQYNQLDKQVNLAIPNSSC